jgi:soluble lytic murein transglycosylase-like protein
VQPWFNGSFFQDVLREAKDPLDEFFQMTSVGSGNNDPNASLDSFLNWEPVGAGASSGPVDFNNSGLGRLADAPERNLYAARNQGNRTRVPQPELPQDGSPAPAAPAPQVDETNPYVQHARSVATKYGVDPNIFVRQIQAESGFRPDARSPAGALGIAQFMPGTAASMGVNPMNPQQALDGAARHMASLLKKYGGDYHKALAAYNAGAGTVDKYGGVPPYAETQTYVRTILGE